MSVILTVILVVMCSLEKCLDPSEKTNATVVGKGFYHGQEVEFICLKDSVLYPSRSRKLRCQDGNWRGEIPSCKGIR